MQSVRRQILQVLKQDGQATVADLAERLGMAPVSVRYHLDILLGDNLIQAAKESRPAGAVGRPRQVYSLTKAADEHFPDNLAALTAGIVRQLKHLVPEDQVQQAFRGLAQQIAAPLLAEAPAGENREQRMARVVAFLNERGYLARWQEDSGLLLTHNCPYRDVAGEHLELCCMDLALVELLTGCQCERVQSLAAKDPCCSYRLVGEPAGQPPSIELISE